MTGQRLQWLIVMVLNGLAIEKVLFLIKTKDFILEEVRM